MNERDFADLCDRALFPENAAEALWKDYRALLNAPDASGVLEKYRGLYEERRPFPFYQAQKDLRAASRNTGVHEFTCDFLLYLHLCPALHAFYLEKGLSERLFTGVLEDLRCKLLECLSVYNIPGSFVAIWFSRFFDFSLYTLGRLEFCLIPCPFDYARNGLRIAKGMPCIDVHIPSKGRLKREEINASYDEAAAFFADRLRSDAVFHCESWLLFEEHASMLPPECGIRRFAADYDYMGKAPDEGDLWRIFGADFRLKPEELPEDTLLRRAYKERLIRGLPVYGGEGLFFYDIQKAQR